MPLFTLFRDKFEVPDESLVELRTRFIEEIDSEPEKAANYHPDDIQRVKENDWFLARYLLHQELNVDNALKMLEKSLQFRCEMEINTLKEEDFPESFFELRKFQIYNKDKNNYPVLVCRNKVHVKDKEKNRLNKQFFLYWLEKAVRSNDWGPICFLLDCTDAAYRNVDLDSTKYMVPLFQQYYPWTLSLFIVYNLPWYMSALWQVVKPWVPEKAGNRIVFVDQNSILEYIDKDQLPVCMGGTCTDQYDSQIEEQESIE